MSTTDTGPAAAADSPDLPVVVVLGAGIGGQAVAAALAHTARLVVVDRDLDTLHVFTCVEVDRVPPARASSLRAVAG